MNEKYELINHIHKDASMGLYTTNKLLETLKDKDNKIKSLVEDILHEYEDYAERSKLELEDQDITPDESGIMSKMGANMGIMKDVMIDNSDSSIADMMIKGISMGTTEMEKKIKDYEKEVDKDHIKMAKDFLKFQEQSIEKLKEYL